MRADTISVASPRNSGRHRRAPERVDLVENTFVAFVMAENVSEAMAAGQVQAAESGLGPNEPIDWALVFMVERHHRNVNDDKDDS
jgi:hypothetical protein